ncbi:MAG TPA: Lrp/AsnC family transcriptional regulator [Clostridiales bacterium]|nr:Lrp/AsnC family transcriptional regulator [Clostridiales bacterium]
MDDIDIHILKILSNHARLTVSEISNQVNMSIPAVSERLKKLESSGIIEKYTIILNSRKLEKDLTAIMLVSIERTKSVGDFLNIVENSKDVLECHYIAGDYDYLLKIVTENTLTLEALLNKIKSVRGVQKTKTVIVLSTIKNNPSILP